MKKYLLGAALALTMAASATAETTITVHYSYPDLVRPVHDRIAAKLMADNPDIKVKFKAATPEYNAGMQLLLRGAVTGDLPDVTFPGINWQRTVIERNLAQPINDLIAAEADWSARGYSQALEDVTTFGGKVYGLPLAISTPVIFYNAELIKRAGGDPTKLPTTWDEAFALAAKIDALGDDIMGMHLSHYGGTWFWQSLITSQGASIMNAKETALAFDGDAGLNALKLYDRAMKEGGMVYMGFGDAKKAFNAGKLGFYVNSTAQIGRSLKDIGSRFELLTGKHPLPGGRDKGRLAAGGNVGMILSTDEKKKQAAFEYIKLAASAWGSTVTVTETGYMPVNKNAADDPTFLKEFYEKNPIYTTTLDQLDIITAWYAFPGENGLKAYKAIHDNVVAVLTGEATPEAAHKKMTADVRALLQLTN